MIYIITLLLVALFWLGHKYSRLKADELIRAKQTYADIKAGFEWQARQAAACYERELKVARQQEREATRLDFERWKAEYTEAERADAVKKSRAVNKGLISEQFAPYLAGWPYAPKDCHFSGQPIDYLVFDGLDDGELKQVVLVDVKTGQSQLNARERQVRDAVAFGRVKFEVFRPEEAN